MDYATAQKESVKYMEHRDCAVKAIAIATDTDYGVVRQMLAAKGRRARQGTKMTIIIQTIKDLGFALLKHEVRGSTVSNVTRELQEGEFLVSTSGHILCVKNGVAEDWTAGRQHRVREVMRVVRIGTKVKPVAPVAPVVTPVVRPQGVKATIHQVAWEMWEAAGQPKGVAELLKLRVQVMNVLEQQGVKRTSASNELGNWQKLVLAQK